MLFTWLVSSHYCTLFPPNEGQEKKKTKQAKWVLKEDVDLDAWAGNVWENQMNKAEGK